LAPCVCAVSGARRNHEPAPRDGERSAATATRCETPGEPAARRRAMPIHPLREASRPRRVGTSSRRRVRRPATRPEAFARTDGERALEGQSPGRHRRPGSFGDPVAARARRETNALKANRVGSAPRERRRRRTSGGPGPREGHPPRRGERLEGRSPGTLRRIAPGGSVVDAARGVAKPRTRHAGGGGIRRPECGSADPACVVGQRSPGEEAPWDGSSAGCRRCRDATVRGSDEPTSGGARKRKGGRPAISVAEQARPVGPKGVANAARVGREPMTVHAAGSESPERRETPGETA
jgi:hypothetical protein